VTTPESEELWVIAPLLEAGLDLDDVRELLFRVSFECVVRPGQADPAGTPALLEDRPAAVRAAWIETVDRMLRVPEASTGL